MRRFFLAPPAFAQGPLGLESARGVGLPGGLPELILRGINAALVLAAVLALAFLVYGGFRYITSRGEEEDVTLAKNVITNAVIGLVVLGLAAALVNFVIARVLGLGGPAPAPADLPVWI